METFVVQASILQENVIFLVGMMGAGKTTVGKHLAKLLDCRFIDTDHMIQERCGVSIPTIFEIEGESGFRQRESAVLKECATFKNTIVATGGGIVTIPENREFLKQQTMVIYLRGRHDELFSRVKHDPNRPLLKTENPYAKFKSMVEIRDPLYKEVAHHTIDTGRLGIQKLVHKIVPLICASNQEHRNHV